MRDENEDRPFLLPTTYYPKVKKSPPSLPPSLSSTKISSPKLPKHTHTHRSGRNRTHAYATCAQTDCFVCLFPESSTHARTHALTVLSFGMHETNRTDELMRLIRWTESGAERSRAVGVCGGDGMILRLRLRTYLASLHKLKKGRERETDPSSACGCCCCCCCCFLPSYNGRRPNLTGVES